MIKALAILCLLASLVLGCQPAEDDTIRVRFKASSADRIAQDCPSLIGSSTGCTVREKDGSITIWIIPPKNVEDERAMIPIGHEVWCHGWLKQSHSNKDPSQDCVGDKRG